MTLSDRIERTMVLPAPRQRVWEAITKPEQLAHWFGVVSDMDFRVGGAIHFTWKNEPCPYAGQIEVIEEPHRFAFRWPSYAVCHRPQYAGGNYPGRPGRRDPTDAGRVGFCIPAPAYSGRGSLPGQSAGLASVPFRVARLPAEPGGSRIAAVAVLVRSLLVVGNA